MKAMQTLMVIMAAFAFFGSAMASPPGKTVEYKTPMGTVTFDGKVHADKGLKCTDCHVKIFQMKKGADKMSMAAINKGEFCGVCHNGTKAFKASDPANCKKCHKK